MSNAHTPGPWVYHPKTNTVQPYPGSGNICLPTQREGYEANARLIAAAPDLLAALAEMLADADTMNEPYRNEAICERARAAIAKATGKETNA